MYILKKNEVCVCITPEVKLCIRLHHEDREMATVGTFENMRALKQRRYQQGRYKNKTKRWSFYWCKISYGFCSTNSIEYQITHCGFHRTFDI